MRNVIKHILIPAGVAVIFFVIVALPVEVFGCRRLGLLAAGVAIAAAVAGIVAAARAILGRIRGEINSSLWMVSALILSIPLIFIVVGGV